MAILRVLGTRDKSRGQMLRASSAQSSVLSWMDPSNLILKQAQDGHLAGEWCHTDYDDNYSTSNEDTPVDEEK